MEPTHPMFLGVPRSGELETAVKTLGISSQIKRQKDDPNLARDFAKNDRMLRYRRIHDLFFSDIFFTTKNQRKLSRGHTCCQMFVTDKAFVYVVLMRSRSEVLQVMKQFAKEVGAPCAISCDAACVQTSLDLMKFLVSMGIP